MLGRVSSLDWLIPIGLLPISFAITAPVAEVLGARATLIGAALIGTGVTLGALFLPGMRAIEGVAGREHTAGSAPDGGPELLRPPVFVDL
jgi:DHA3 family tetracycline resistance protein-like MFS transporter